MARNRSPDEILDQVVYAVACVARHYGPGLSAEGLKWVRDQLQSDTTWVCDSTWRVDTQEGDGDPNPDFHPLVLDEDDPPYFTFEEVVQQSRTGEDE